ncbi:hypothetical protein MNBD_GAMMA26-1426 [hydrothermal vent metagenome]|uniref:DUF928 domain-containing protein n=1 Tax=hydrothermal vent metagenome TaxID=652676 RepID=A0A3B1B9Z9_9ZZZZ
MKTDQTSFYLLFVGIITIFMAWGAGVLAGGSELSPKGSESILIYKPPFRGAPKSRVGGGVRGTGSDFSTLVVLAPEHTGLTLKEQPTLYWYLSSRTMTSLAISIVDDEQLQSLVEQRMPSQGGGIQRVRLADLSVRLKPGVEYRWNVALISDLEQRSNDIVASGSIKRVTATGDLRERLKQAAPADGPRILAAAGLWYDAMEAASELVEKYPEQVKLRRQRAILLEQVNLKEVADLSYD